MDMPQSSVRRAPRFITLIVVAMLHLGLIALLLLASAQRRIPPSSYRPIELVYIPTPPLPRVRAESGRPERLRANVALSQVSPMFMSAPPSAPSSGTGSHGNGVDWLAEAHRAVRAYEIRRDHPEQSALSGKSPANDWWPQQGPHAGDQFKTDGGDWIVWISPECYKVASWHSSDPGIDPDPPQIICPGKATESHGTP
jgi:hypothetical protein